MKADDPTTAVIMTLRSQNAGLRLAEEAGRAAMVALTPVVEARDAQGNVVDLAAVKAELRRALEVARIALETEAA